MSPNYLSRQEASKYLTQRGVKVAPATLARWFSTTNDGPPVVHFGRKPLYPVEQLNDWLRTRMTAPRTSSSIPRERADA